MTQRERERIALEILEELDSYLDFGDPIKAGYPFTFEDTSGINMVFARANALLQEDFEANFNHTDQDEAGVTTHTPEPWRIGKTGGNGAVSIVAGNRPPTLVTEAIHSRTDQDALANARRIVACVNACAGIPTEALERGVVWELIGALERIVNYHPDLVGQNQALKQEIDECQDCKRARQQGWPPSGLRDRHYARMSREVWEHNERAQDAQHCGMRDIARTVLDRIRGEVAV